MFFDIRQGAFPSSADLTIDIHECAKSGRLHPRQPGFEHEAQPGAYPGGPAHPVGVNWAGILHDYQPVGSQLAVRFFHGCLGRRHLVGIDGQ